MKEFKLPKKVYMNDQLTPKDKIVYSVIYTKQNEDGQIIIKNEDCEKLLNLEKSNIRHHLRHLEDAGLVFFTSSKYTWWIQLIPLEED